MVLSNAVGMEPILRRGEEGGLTGESPVLNRVGFAKGPITPKDSITRILRRPDVLSGRTRTTQDSCLLYLSGPAEMSESIIFNWLEFTLQLWRGPQYCPGHLYICM